MPPMALVRAAMLIATCAVATGVGIMWTPQASYSDDFSTTFRVARGAHLSVPVEGDDVKGADPLPKHLVNAKVWFVSGVE